MRLLYMAEALHTSMRCFLYQVLYHPQQPVSVASEIKGLCLPHCLQSSAKLCADCHAASYRLLLPHDVHIAAGSPLKISSRVRGSTCSNIASMRCLDMNA